MKNKKMIPWILVLSLITSLLPTSAFASDEGNITTYDNEENDTFVVEDDNNTNFIGENKDDMLNAKNRITESDIDGYDTATVFSNPNDNLVAFSVENESNTNIQFSGGDGTKENPYQISTATQLDAIRNDMDAHYVLINDINLSTIENWYSLNSSQDSFSGCFDGDGYEISNIPSAGLFKTISSTGVIRNLKSNFKSSSGVLALENNGTIENCVLSGRVSGTTELNWAENNGSGGFVSLNKGTIQYCRFIGKGEDDVYGSLVGSIAGKNYGKILSCESVNCSISARTQDNGLVICGGIVGLNYGSIELCKYTGFIESNISKASYFCGGIVGANLGTIDKCYFNGCLKTRSSISTYAGRGGISGCNGSIVFDRSGKIISNCVYVLSEDSSTTIVCPDSSSKYTGELKTNYSNIVDGRGIVDEIEKELNKINPSTSDYKVKYGIRRSIFFLDNLDTMSNEVTFTGDFSYKLTENTTLFGVNSIDQLLGKYVLVELKTEQTTPEIDPIITNEIVSLKAVTSKIGTVLDVNSEDNKISFEKDIFLSAASDCALSSYKGKEVLYHIYDGTVVGIDILQEKSGILEGWNTSTKMVTIDGIQYPTNYMTDTSFLTSIDQKLGEIVNFYTVGDNSYAPVLRITPNTYETNSGIFQQYDKSSATAVFENTSIPVNTVKAGDISSLVGKQVFFLLENGKIIHMDMLSKVTSSLHVALSPKSDNVEYKNKVFSTSKLSTTLTIRHSSEYDFPEHYDKSVVYTAANLVPIQIESIIWEGDSNLVFSNGDLPTEQIAAGESKQIRIQVSFLDKLFHRYIPTQATETLNSTVTVTAKAFGKDEQILAKTNFTVNVKNQDAEEKQETSNESKNLASIANTELNKITKVLAVDKNIMKSIFGLSGKAVTQFEQELLSIVVMSDLPKDSLEEYIQKKAIEKVFGKYKPKFDASATGYTVPLEYIIETPNYGKVKVKFNCKVTTSTLANTRTGMFVAINYEIIDSEKPISETLKSGNLGIGTVADISAFQSAVLQVVESELKTAYNKAWGNNANKVADFLFDDCIKLILEMKKTTFKDVVWKLVTWPTKNETIKCPVNVYVYDESGTQRGAIINDMVTQSSDDFELFVNGSTKYIENLDETYSVKFVATGNGMMDIGITENLGYNTPYRQIAYYQIPLQIDGTYSQNLPSGIFNATAEYNLTSNTNKIITATTSEVVVLLHPDNDSAPYVITFSLNDGTDDKGNDVLTDISGKLLALDIPLRQNYTFDGWYTSASGGSRITTNTVFTKDTVVYAHWKYNNQNSISSIAATSISLSPTSVTLTAIGETKPLTATVTPSNATNKSVTWVSSKPNVATVSNSGVVTAVANGQTTITATTADGGYQADCIVTVNIPNTSPSGSGNGSGNSSSSSSGNHSSKGSQTIQIGETKNGTIKIDNPSAAIHTFINITAIADEGYQLEQLKVYNEQNEELSIMNIGKNQYSFLMPNGKVFIEGTFVKTEEAAEVIPTDAQNKDILVPFTDISGTWYQSAVEYTYKHGLMHGISKTTFGGDLPTNRGMFASILWSLEECPDSTYTHLFTDVTAKNYYHTAVCWATEHQIISGLNEISFAPNNSLTREQLATMLYRYAKHKGYDTTQTNTTHEKFIDSDTISDYARDGVIWAVQNNLLSGKDKQILDPKGVATRAEIASILMRFCQNCIK